LHFVFSSYLKAAVILIFFYCNQNMKPGLDLLYLNNLLALPTATATPHPSSMMKIYLTLMLSSRVNQIAVSLWFLMLEKKREKMASNHLLPQFIMLIEERFM